MNAINRREFSDAMDLRRQAFAKHSEQWDAMETRSAYAGAGGTRDVEIGVAHKAKENEKRVEDGVAETQHFWASQTIELALQYVKAWMESDEADDDDNGDRKDGADEKKREAGPTSKMRAIYEMLDTANQTLYACLGVPRASVIHEAWRSGCCVWTQPFQVIGDWHAFGLRMREYGITVVVDAGSARGWFASLLAYYAAHTQQLRHVVYVTYDMLPEFEQLRLGALPLHVWDFQQQYEFYKRLAQRMTARSVREQPLLMLLWPDFSLIRTLSWYAGSHLVVAADDADPDRWTFLEDSSGAGHRAHATLVRELKKAWTCVGTWILQSVLSHKQVLLWFRRNVPLLPPPPPRSPQPQTRPAPLPPLLQPPPPPAASSRPAPVSGPSRRSQLVAAASFPLTSSVATHSSVTPHRVSPATVTPCKRVSASRCVGRHWQRPKP